MFTRRSRKWYILAPRRVTAVPMGFPSLTLKFAMDFRARVIIGFWPLITVRSWLAASMALALVRASPTPIFSTIFCNRGTSMGLP